MNSNADYTICNLDNNTYTTHYGPPVAATSGYGYSNVNNGYVDTGQIGYNMVQQEPSPDLEGQGAMGGAHYPHPGSTVISHTPSPGQGAQGYGNIPFHTCIEGMPTPVYSGYYSPGMNNGGADLSLNMSQSPATAYDVQYHSSPSNMCHGASPSPGPYGDLNGTPGHAPHPSQQSDTGQVTTYKWMTVKRTTSKATIPGKYLFLCFTLRVSPGPLP